MRKYFIFLFLCNGLWASSSFNWNSTTVLSDPGDTNAPIGAVVSNNVDETIAIWSRYVSENWIVETAYSENNGKNWLAPVTDIDSGNQSLNPSPQIALNDNNVAVAVFVTFDDPQYTIQQAYSADGGQNWTTSGTPLDSAVTEIKEPQIAIQGEDHAVACWTGEGGVIKSSYSLDGGATWSASPVNLSAAGAGSPQVATNIVDETCVVYELGGDILGSYTVDEGATWTASTLETLGTAEKPKIVMNDLGSVVAVWRRLDANYVIVESFSLDGGATWSSPRILSDADENADNPKLCLDSNGDTVVVWESDNGDHTVIQYAYSFDGGNSFPSRIDISSLSEDSFNPDVSINDDGIAAIVYENSSDHNILACSSVDAGVVFSSPVVMSSSAGSAVNPVVAVNGQDYAIVLWSIDRSSSYTVETLYGNFFNVYLTQDKKNLLFQRDYVNKIFCDPMPETSLYRVYSDDDLTEMLYEGSTPEFFDHGQQKGESKTYYVTWADLYGERELSSDNYQSIVRGGI